MIQEVGIRKLDPKKVSKLAAKYGVSSDQFEEQLLGVYSRFLREMLQEDGVAISQVTELGAMRKGLGLEWNATQALHPCPNPNPNPNAHHNHNPEPEPDPDP